MKMQACKWIVGATPFLDQAYAAWTEAYPEDHIEKIFLPQNSLHQFDFSSLEKLNANNGSVFIAFDERFGNFKRAELMQSIMERGFKLTTFISKNSIISKNSKIGLNAFIGDGAIIGSGSKIDYNTVILPGVRVGNNVTIRQSCWIEMGVQLENNVSIGAHSTLRSGSIVANGVNVGRGCELGWTKRYIANIPAKTIFDERYDEVIRTY